MRKKNAGERKRTVTIVIGPETAALLDCLARRIGSAPNPLDATWSDVIGGIVSSGLRAYAVTWEIPLIKENQSHFD